LQKVAYAEWALAEYYALSGRPAAKKHARKAMRGLPESSVEYLRARDILAAEF